MKQNNNEAVEPETLAQVLARLTKVRESLKQGYSASVLPGESGCSDAEKQMLKDAVLPNE